jgi:hypothetical protein
MSMTPTARAPVRGGRLRLAVAGAVVLTALTTAPAAAMVQFPGFVLDRGRYRTIEAPEPGVWQFPFDINDRGQISGEYVRVGSDGIPDSESGFLRDARGRTSVLDVPGAKGTEATKLNNRGQVAGTFSTDTPIVSTSASPRSLTKPRVSCSP